MVYRLAWEPGAMLSSKVAKSRAPTTISRGARPVVAKEMTVRAMWTNLRRRFGMAMLASVGRAPAKPGHVKGTSRILVNARRGMTNYVMSLASIRSGNLPTASLPALVERRLNGPSLQPIGRIPERPLELGRSRVSRVHAIAHGCRSRVGSFVRGLNYRAHSNVEFLACVSVDPGLVWVRRRGTSMDVASYFRIDPKAREKRAEHHLVWLSVSRC